MTNSNEVEAIEIAVAPDQDGQLLSEVLAAQPDLTVVYDPPHPEWGRFVRALNGDASVDGRNFWSITSEGNFTDGVDSYRVRAGEVIIFTLTDIVENYQG